MKTSRTLGLTVVIGLAATFLVLLMSQTPVAARQFYGQGGGMGPGQGLGPNGGICSLAPLQDASALCCCVALAPRTEDGELVPLTDSEQNALKVLIADEYASRAVYLSVLAKFGPVRPFSRIVFAESNHIAALAAQFDLYGLPVPEETEIELPEFNTYVDALMWAIASEEANATLYDTRIAETDKENLITVFTHLRDASRDHHKVAFERALGRWAR